MPTRAEHMFTPSALGRTKIKRTLPSCRAMLPIRSCDVSCQEGRERRGEGWMDGWMDGDDKPRRTRSAEEPRQKLASESIMRERGEWHRLQETTKTATSYPIRQLCRSGGRASECERPKVDNTFRSFSVCLPEIEEESGRIQHRLFPSLPHFPKME